MNNSKQGVPGEINHHQVETITPLRTCLGYTSMVQMDCLDPLRLYLNHITDLLATRFEIIWEYQDGSNSDSPKGFSYWWIYHGIAWYSHQKCWYRTCGCNFQTREYVMVRGPLPTPWPSMLTFSRVQRYAQDMLPWYPCEIQPWLRWTMGTKRSSSSESLLRRTASHELCPKKGGN